MLFFQDGITGPGSYRFSCPTSFGKIFLHLFSSVVGLDASCVLDGIQEAQPSTFVPSSKKVPPTSVKKSGQKKPGQKQQQKKISSFSSTQTSKTSKRKDNRNHGKARSSRAHSVPSHSHCSSRIQRKVPLGSKTIPTAAQNEVVQRGTKEVTPPTHMLRNESFRAVQHTGDYQQNRFSQSVPGRVERCCPDDEIMHIPPIRHIRDSRQHAGEPAIPLAMHSQVLREDASKKRNFSAPWQQTKRKQQRSQQRAFASKRDNPFAHFQHDPNDAESYLEGLSSQNQGQKRFQNSLIPQSKLDHFQKYSNTANRPSYQTKSRGFGRQRMDRRRRPNGVHQPVSNQELLRRKADESQAQFAAHQWSHPNREADFAEYLGAPVLENSYSNFEHPQMQGHHQVGMADSWPRDHRTPTFEQPFDPRFQPSITQPETFPGPITPAYQESMQADVPDGGMAWHSSVETPTGASYESTHLYPSLPYQRQMQASQLVPPSQSSGQHIPIPQYNQRGWSQQDDEESQFREVFF